MASIQRIKSSLTGEISYRVQIRVRGRPSESETFPNKKEALDWAAATETAIRDGRHFPHRRAARTAFDGLVKKYTSFLEDAELANAEARKQHLAWFAKQFAGLSLGEITPDRVSEARDALAAEKFSRGKPKPDEKTGQMILPPEYKRSGATVNRYLATLSHVFSLAVREWRLVVANPVRDITKKKESRGRVRFLTDEERAALMKACAASSWKPLQLLVQLALSTGARRSELIGLKWSDLNLPPPSKNEEPVIGTAIVHDTKNGDSRTLPIVGKALEALRELKKEKAVRDLKLKAEERSEYLFQQPSGLPGAYENFDGVWYAALKAAGLNDLRFHDLRHSTASYLAQQGASLLEIADTLGHRTMQMVKRYAHLTQTHKVAALEKLAREKGL
jgi:integrase